MQKTEINWTENTWGTASGCTKVSPGCKHCYAEGIAEQKRGTKAFPNGFDITLRRHKMAEPRRLKPPSLIFTNSMTDLFHADIPDAFRDEQCSVMAEVERHRYQVLTKRPENAARYFDTREVPRSVWLGVTVENQDYLGRADILRTIAARVRFLSIEPLLGPIDLRGFLDGIHWVIVGGESGHHLMRPDECAKRGLVRRGGRGERTWVPREDRMQWVRDIRDACADAGVPFYFKQWGGSRGPLAGRELDGKTHDSMPTLVGAMPENYDQASASVCCSDSPAFQRTGTSPVSFVRSASACQSSRSRGRARRHSVTSRAAAFALVWPAMMRRSSVRQRMGAPHPKAMIDRATSSTASSFFRGLRAQWVRLWSGTHSPTGSR